MFCVYVSLCVHVFDIYQISYLDVMGNNSCIFDMYVAVRCNVLQCVAVCSSNQAYVT